VGMSEGIGNMLLMAVGFLSAYRCAKSEGSAWAVSG